MSFAKQLKKGLIGEGHIAQWLIRRGNCVLPAYQVEVDSGKGPRLFTPLGAFVSPDMMVFNGEQIFWIEAKTKEAFTYYRKKKQWESGWQTGIDLHHWNEYQKVRETMKVDVFLLFLQGDGIAKDTPEGMECPSGLYGNTIDALASCEDHKSPEDAYPRMIYWRVESLKKWAELDEVVA